MKLHCRTRKGNTVRVTLRDGSVRLWQFSHERRDAIVFTEGSIDKRQLRAFVALKGKEWRSGGTGGD